MLGGVGWGGGGGGGCKLVKMVLKCKSNNVLRAFHVWRGGVVWSGVVVVASWWWCYNASQTVCSQPLIIMLVEECVCVWLVGGGGGQQVCGGVTMQITEAISSDPLMIY